MWAEVAIIAGIIGLAAIISHRLLHPFLTSGKSHMHKPKSKDEKQNNDDSEPQPKASFKERKGLFPYLTSGKSQKQKPQSQDKNQNEAGCTEQEAKRSDSDCIHALDELDSILKSLKESTEPEMHMEVHRQGYKSNSSASDALIWRRPLLRNVMEALADPNTFLIGFYGSSDESKDSLLEKVFRRVQRDKLFDMVLTATITKKPDVKKIQEEIAHQLRLTFNHKSKDKRAQELSERIKIEQKILIVLYDLQKGLDLGQVGIPYGSDHTGCKILLTSITEDVLSNPMRTQKNFMV